MMLLHQSSKFIIMPSFLYTLLGLAVGTLHCSVRQQISPCTCTYDTQNSPNTINVVCEKMSSFSEVKRSLQGQFTPAQRVKLRITHSNLQDVMQNNLANDSFGDIDVLISHLNISDNNLTTVRPDAFLKMGNVTFLNLADNLLTEVPVSALGHMPRLCTLSISGNHLTSLRNNDFGDLKHLQTLVLADNMLEEIGDLSVPRHVQRLFLSRNKLVTLNGALRELNSLEWLHVAQNDLRSLDGELPVANKLTFINASHNALQSLPATELRALPSLDALFVDHNEICSLEGALNKAKKLVILSATYNNITKLDEGDFTETESLLQLLLGHNHINQLSGALRPLRALERLSIHHNLLQEFDLSEVRGLRQLQELDLRHNLIEHLYSNVEMQNVVEVDTAHVTELRLGHNSLQELDGFLRGLPGLRSLDLSHNQFKHLPPDELLGLDELRFLDLSYNKLTSLADMSKKVLPVLETLLAGHNELSVLQSDLHGLPVLCVADLSYNKIVHVGTEVAKGGKCLVRGVPGTLRIFLQGNLLKCDRELAMAQDETDNSRAELVGIPDCNLLSFLEEPEPVKPATDESILAVGESYINALNQAPLVENHHVTTPPAE